MKACIRILGLVLLLMLPACAGLAISVQEAKVLPDTSHVSLIGKAVTYAGSNFFYIEEDNRSMGIRVEKTGHGLTVGMRADVDGNMATKSDSNERYIVANTATETPRPYADATITPMGMGNNALGGGDWSVVGTGGQQGISGAYGLNNIGLLVKTCGQFQQINSTTFTISDAAGSVIQCTVPSGTFLSSAWQSVIVTGISSMYNASGSYLPVLLVTDIDVVLPAEAVSTPGSPAGETGPLVNLAYSYATTASTCSQGHTVEYSFNWGDGTSPSAWSTSTTAWHVWSTTGAKTVTVTARCQTHTGVTATSAALVVTPVTTLASSPWPVFRHDTRHSGVSQYHDPAGLIPAWSLSVGNGYSSPSIGSDGTIYISGTNSLRAINPDGSLKWSSSISSSTRSTPALASDGTIYIGASGYVYAFDSTGAQKWAYSVSGGDVTASPAIGSDGVVYVGSRNHTLYAINPNGSPKWSVGLGGDIHMTSPVVNSTGSVVYCGGGTTVWALNTSNGSVKWQRSIGVGMTSSASLSPDGSTVYIGAYDGNMYSINATTGVINWQAPVGFVNASTSASPAIASDGTIYLGSNFGTLYAYNPDGTQKWLYETGSDIRASVALNSDGTVVVASYDGYVRGLDSTTGLEKWHNLLPASNYASPAIAANGTVIACSTAGIVYSLMGGTPMAATAPTDLTVTLTSDTQASLSWTDNSSDEYGFAIERRVGTLGEYTTLATVAANAYSYVDSGLLSGKNYYYRVCAYQSAGNSEYTNEASIWTPGIRTPDDLVVTGTASTEVDLTWADMSSDETGFSIERSMGPNGLFEEIGQVGPNVTSYNDTTAYPARFYHYRVRAFDATRQSSYSNAAEALTSGRDFSEILHGNTTRKQLALTFDAGTAAIQSTLLDSLKTNNVYCNFFITGVVTQLQSTLLARIASDGHFTGNHTWDHPDLRYVSDARINTELNTTEDIIFSTGGKHTRPYFRAPYGAKNTHVINVAAADGFQHVNWTQDTGDSGGASQSQIATAAINGASNGAIILCHCTITNTANAVPTIISTLKGSGWEFVTIPELVAPKQVTSPAGFLTAGWNLISLPIEPALEFPHIVFRGLTIDSYLKRVDRVTGSEVIYSAASPAAFGNINADEGYWLYVPASNKTIKFNGSSATTDRYIRLRNTSNTANYGLIGYPFETTQNFTNCRVFNPNAPAPQTRSLLEAISLGWIPDRFIGWNQTTHSEYDVILSSAVMEPWHAYKAAALAPGVQLIIPKPL